MKCKPVNKGVKPITAFIGFSSDFNLKQQKVATKLALHLENDALY